MPPRTSARFASSSSTTTAPYRALSALPQPTSSPSPQLLELRRQWKWAAVSQFLYTFASLVALEDVSLQQIEDDLTSSTMLVLPRLMQRLLFTLTQDRKINLDNWQSSLRKQYLKRDPAANPIGVEAQPSNFQSRKGSPQSEAHQQAASERGDVNIAALISEEAMTLTEQPDSGVAFNEVGNEEIKSEAGIHANALRDQERDLLPENDTMVSDAPTSWAQLTMLEKLDSLHILIEWHFQMPSRLRSIMRSDDENASWRIEPIGFNAKHDAYWLIGLDRLWIQRQPPKPPRKHLKRKAASSSTNRRLKAARGGANPRETTFPQSATTSKFNGRETAVDSWPARLTRGHTQQKSEAMSVGKGKARAAKVEAKAKMDEQVKLLAATQAEMRSFGRSRSHRGKEKSPDNLSGRRSLGTRVSRRLRGEMEDEWQPIPPEWLESEDMMENDAKPFVRERRAQRRVPNQSSSNNDLSEEEVGPKTGLESGDDSELTELSDSISNHSRWERDAVEVVDDHPEMEDVQTQGLSEPELAPEPCPPSDFVEWETICVTLNEWEAVAKQFEGATYHAEKYLHKVLSQEIVPAITSILRDIERQRQKEEAIVHRKRSSRIAVKESEKEEQRLAAQRKAEENERLARARRAEARAKKEEEDRLKRELAREHRRKEREEREERMKARRSQTIERSDPPVDFTNDGFTASHDAHGAAGPSNVHSTRPTNGRSQKGKTSSRTEDWHLECEICGAEGVNRDEGVPIMSCGKCAKWQHIFCHDAEDAKVGRQKRNWDVVDFTCRRCSAKYGQRDISLNVGRNTIPMEIPYYSSLPRHTSQDPRSNHYGPKRSMEPRLAVNGQKTPASYSQTDAMHINQPPNSMRGVAPPNFTATTPYQAHTAVTFAHYQPHQRGFSPHVTTPQSGQHAFDYGHPSSTGGYQQSSASYPGAQNTSTWDASRRLATNYPSPHTQTYFDTASRQTYPPALPPASSPVLSHQNRWNGGVSFHNNGIESPIGSGSYNGSSAVVAALPRFPPPGSVNYSAHNGQYTSPYQHPHQKPSQTQYHLPQS